MLNLYQYPKNQLISSFHPWDTADFRVPRPKRPHWSLTTITLKLLKKLLAFLSLYQQTKNQFIPFIASWDTANFRVLRHEWSHPFLTTPQYFSINFWVPWICINMLKIKAFSSIGSRDIVDSKILIDWEHFGPYVKNQIFPKYEICANNINFRYRPNSEKIND